MGGERAVRPTLATCSRCARQFKRPPGVKNKCCSPECRAAASAYGRAKGRTVRGYGERPVLAKVCLGCGKTFSRKVLTNLGARDAGKYCSRGCAFATRANEASRKAVAKAKTEHQARQEERGRRMAASAAAKEQRIAARVTRCQVCQAVIVPLPMGPRRRFCSVACQKASPQWRAHNAEARRKRRRLHGHDKDRHRARRAGVAYRPINRGKLFERDGWRCQLCGCSTPRRLRGKQVDRAPELDHIVPLALGGTHTWDNVQCACRRCNGRKGARVLGQQRLSLDAATA